METRKHCHSEQEQTKSSHVRVAAVLLAAGQGRRMGNQPKALLRLKGMPLIEHHLNALTQAGVDDVVVVTGFYHNEVAACVAQRAVKVAHNPRPDAGQASSVRLGIETLGREFDVVIMMLCDQPLMTAADLTTLLTAFQNRSHGEVLIPRVRQQRGNPVVFSGMAIGEILDQGPSMHCRRYIDEHPELVSYFDTDNEHFILDVDTLDDLDRFEQTTGWSLSA